MNRSVQDKLETKFTIKLEDELYEEALRHNFNKIDKSDKRITNARLAYLGDFIVNAVIGDYYFRKYPDWTPGNLTKDSNDMQSDTFLAQKWLELGIEDEVLGPNSPNDALGKITMHAKALEALFGAIYYIHGYGLAKELIITHIVDEELLERLREDGTIKPIQSALLVN
ncbi:MAG: ribonuclease III domain-containing protein [Thermoplasmata archaeon]|nr:ribonuclease III domain-containing protein [Thermoplasmata archaeon]